MKCFKWSVALWLALALAACGGGGGSAGTVSSTTTTAGALAVQLVDGAGAALRAPSLSPTEARSLKVTLTSTRGELQSFKRVTVTLDSPLAILTPQSGSQLTDANGVALFAIAPASVTASGAVTATVKATVDGTELSQALDLQIVAGDVGLSGLSVTPASVQLGQSVNVSVNASINGVPAASNALTVMFSSACGTVSPASAPVDAAGKASAVIQTTGAGSCTVAATAAGVAQSVVASYTVVAAPVTGIQFVSASPAVIYQSDSVGVNSSLVKFKVIDSNGQPVGGQTVGATVVNASGGLHFCDSTVAGRTAVSAATTGEVSFAVCAGTQPETAQVRATLAAPAGIHTDSNLLTVQTGLPTQRFFDIAAEKLNFYCGGRFTSQRNNDFVSITVNLADRQGNPVPNGTPVALVTEGGQINSSNVSSCLIDGGACSVKLICQDYRPLGSVDLNGKPLGDPRPGRVTVLAMADGEESFIDANNNNRYDPGELFEDLGAPFMDKNEDGLFTAAYQNLVVTNGSLAYTDEGEVSYPIAAEARGGLPCLQDNANPGLSQSNTCNQVWNGSGIKPDGSRYKPTKVRRSIVIVFSGGEIGQPGFYHDSIPADKQTAVIDKSSAAIRVRLADWDGNPLPADANISVVANQGSGNSNCAATLLNSTIGSSTEPTEHVATLKDCKTGNLIDFKVDVKAGLATRSSVFSVTVP